MPRVHTIDLHYLGIPRAIAAYVVIDDEAGNGSGAEPVLIETGPASTLHNLVDGLGALGLKIADIRHALVTHIHLDHAGAAGHLARQGVRIHVHPLGLRHLADPAKLVKSASRIYGDQMDRLWGPIVPAPEDMLSPVHDGDVIEIGRLRFTALETPGHAKHHHAFALAQDEGEICFAGDIAGITVPGIAAPPAGPPNGRFIAVPTPPPEFEPELWLASIDRLKARNFSAIYPTHFGRRENPAAHFDRLRHLISQHAEFVRRELEAGLSREQIIDLYVEWNRAAALADGITPLDFGRYVSDNLLQMNVDGIIRYWTTRTEDVDARLGQIR